MDGRADAWITPSDAAAALLGRRIARREHEATKAACEASLYEFIKYCWPAVEPETRFVGSWVIRAICEHLEAVADGRITRLNINVFPGAMKSLICAVFFPAWLWGPRSRPHLRFLCFSYAAYLTERDNRRFLQLVQHQRYRDMWGDRFRLVKESVTQPVNDHTGWKLASSVGGVGTGERGDVVVIDDGNRPPTDADPVGDSNATLRSTAAWFREILPDRLNSLERSAIINIQQRVSDLDISGVILDLGLSYDFLSIPMMLDTLPDKAGNRRPIIETLIGWIDPRLREDWWIVEGDEAAGIEPDNEYDPVGEVVDADEQVERDGTPADLVRFPLEQLEELRQAKGSYAWCTPAESPVLMGDLSLRPIAEVSVGETVIGFETARERANGGRAKLRPAEVISISKSVRPVVRMTMDSGEVIRSTADHRWYTGRYDKSHPQYAPAYAAGAKLPGNRSKGSSLHRVCPARLPKLTDPDQLRAAGWLAGFYDGEGSATILHRREDDTGSILVTFTQSEGKNRELCEKLEKALAELGFAYGSKTIHNSAKNADWSDVRHYWLASGAGVGTSRGRGELQKRGPRLGLYQRFLHVVRPTKWRQRIIDVMSRTRMLTTQERVISIIPDGEETVYGLETTTGNYVVWGFASSNSSQYMQTVSPRGGGIIKEEHWQNWLSNEFPEFGTCIASVDTAYKQHEEADYNACVIISAFEHPESGKPKLMIRAAWQVRCSMEDLAKRLLLNCREHKVETLLIEDSARGPDVAHEIVRLMHRGEIVVTLIPAVSDKVARLNACQPIFENAVVYAPITEWADSLIAQVSRFPRASHDDMVDALSMGLIYLRRTGVATRREEHDEEVLQRRRYRREPEPVYPA